MEWDARSPNSLGAREMSKNKRFGDYAVDFGFCTRGDVLNALNIQRDLIDRGHGQLLLGLVMVRYGIISNHELIQVLKVLEREHVDCLIAD